MPERLMLKQIEHDTKYGLKSIFNTLAAWEVLGAVSAKGVIVLWLV